MTDDRWRDDDNRRNWSEDRFRQGGERPYGERDRYRSVYERSYGADRSGRDYARVEGGYGERPSFDEGSAYGRSGYGRDISYGQGYAGRRAPGYGASYGPFGQGYAGYGYGRSAQEDPRRAYGPNDWRDDQDDDRNWWDRTKDQVKAWGGDDDARRRRELDEAQHNRGRGPRGYTRSDEKTCPTV